ncbi:MAG: NAD-dependent epimerase/dehydratase family protein [Flavobacteriales bacterium]
MDLVTGGTGIVGAHLLLELLRQGRSVRALRRRGSDTGLVRRVFRHYGQEALADRIEWAEGDLLDVVSLADGLQGSERVYHCAALVSFAGGKAGELFDANVTGTANVVNAALEAGSQRLCLVSSIAALGPSKGGGPLDEAAAWDDAAPASPYAISKHLAEMEAHRGMAEGLPCVIVNPGLVIGPGAEGRSSMALVNRLRQGTRWYTKGANGFVDARDVAACMVKAMERGAPGERYVLVGENASYRRLFELLCEAFGRPAPRLEARPWMLHLARRAEAIRGLLTGAEPLVTRQTVASALARRAYSSSKARERLGHQFLSLEESVANAAAFIKASA